MPNPRIEKLDTGRIALIMSVALEEFARHRYRDASFNRIIKASQMAKGTMYYYFTSKEDLFMTLYKATVREFNRLLPLTRQLPRQKQHYWQTTQELLEGLEQTLLQKPGISQFVLNFLVGGEQQDDHPARATALSVDAWLQQWINQGQLLGVLRSDLTATRLTAITWGLWQAIHPLRTPASGAGDQSTVIIDLLQRLLRPDMVNSQRPVPSLDTGDVPGDLNF
ncbi:MAG TPA: TetR/AcrR family transcriptional regulator [Oligoflexus sp.]|uniref:TetR/AcrR family transcriptional regulator n=1 Tax=Oligoflexus sp. TaxID=1971216 RepID=UPI002D67F91F|nr:TetR/AcrR family transcriptional regulator [Oligoflexus sp.]HYX33443.1 TetR/AcrR family transcriptional regulator [Oligoflexus sp.]